MNESIIIKQTDGLFTLFDAPINNVKPNGITNLRKVYDAIISACYKEQAECLRNIVDPKAASLFKRQNLDYVTFGGIFHTRKDEAIVAHSGLLCVGVDCACNVEELYSKLLHDHYFETQLLFRSVSGRGVKWVIKTDPNAPFRDYAKAVRNYIQQTYGVKVDGLIQSVSRACFLPYDPQAFINQKLRKGDG